MCLFGKVLRNEVDEEFRYVQGHVREGVNAYLKQFIREKHIHKSEPELQRLIDDLTSDKHHLDTPLWQKIIEPFLLKY